MPQGQRTQLISQSYYSDQQQTYPTINQDVPEDVIDVVYSERLVHRKHNTQSRKLPQTLWRILAKSLGIKLQPNDKPIVGLILYVLTLLSSLLYGVTSAYYITFDILAKDTKQNVLTGLVVIMMSFYWCSLGIYANQLAGRLFLSPKVLDSIRLHSKTIFKVSSAALMAVLALLMIGLNIYKVASRGAGSIPTACDTVNLNQLVCYLQFGAGVGYTLFALVWNLLVGVVLLSVCRTHTIGIRRFIAELEADGRLYALSRCQNLMQGPITEQHGLEESCEDYFRSEEEEDDSGLVFTPAHFSSQSPLVTRRTISSASTVSSAVPTSPGSTVPDTPDGANNNGEKDGLDDVTAAEQITESSGPHILSIDEILMSFWRINNRLKETSLILQRWLAGWVFYVMLWSGSFIIVWLKHDATLIGIAEFVIPLLILPILCSAYGEVNHEGRRVLKSICPTADRVHMLMYLQQQPLELTVFGFTVDYMAITKVLGALSLAFATKIVIDEVKL